MKELGDRWPSQLLRHMQTLLGKPASSFDTDIFKELFLQRLPPTAQMFLATAADLTFPALALHADKIMEVTDHKWAVSSTTALTERRPSHTHHDVSLTLEQNSEIAELR